MSELKDYSILDIEAIDDERYKTESAPGKWVPESRVYRKSEADKFIADLEKKLRHANYKLCLAMAERCRLEQERIELIENQDITDDDFEKLIKGFYKKWRNRWLDLAEKFKE